MSSRGFCWQQQRRQTGAGENGAQGGGDSSVQTRDNESSNGDSVSGEKGSDSGDIWTGRLRQSLVAVWGRRGMNGRWRGLELRSLGGDESANQQKEGQHKGGRPGGRRGGRGHECSRVR